MVGYEFGNVKDIYESLVRLGVESSPVLDFFDLTHGESNEIHYFLSPCGAVSINPTGMAFIESRDERGLDILKGNFNSLVASARGGTA